MVSIHQDFICYLQELCSIHLSEAFQFLKLSLDVCIGLHHKGSISQLLILGCLRVEWGVCLECFTQSVIEIGGSLICFLDHRCNLDILASFLAPTRSPCRGITVETQGFLPFSGIEIPIRSRLWHHFSCSSFYILELCGDFSLEPFWGFC